MKKLFISSSLLALTAILSACGGGTPSTAASFNPQLISGKIEETPYKLANVQMFGNDWKVVASSPVTNGNEVSFDLTKVAPDSSQLTGNFTTGCQGENSNPAARLFTVPNLYAYSTEGDLAGYVDEEVVSGTGATVGQNFILRVYADRAIDFTGTCTSTAKETDTLKVSLKQGWNALMVTTLEKGWNLVNVPADAKTTLKFKQATQRVGVDLNPSSREHLPLTLTFNDNNPITVDVELSRVGGYHGTVKLSTDIPGLTVEPATLTLPALPALSMGEQAYKTKLTFRYNGSEKRLDKPFTLLVTDDTGKPVGNDAGRLVVNRSGVLLTFGTQNAVNIYQGESVNVAVNVMAGANFAATTTVALIDLPAGLSASPTAVNLTNNQMATANIPLTASASTPVGTYTISATSPDFTGAMGPLALTVNVLPKRLSLGTGTVSALTRTLAGDLWGAGTAFVSVKGETLAGRFDLPGGVSASAVAVAPDGKPWAKAGGAFYRLNGDKVESFPGAGMPTTGADSFGVDVQGRVWYMAFDGFNSPTLNVLDPVTGTTRTWTKATGVSSVVPVVSDAAGKYVFYPNNEGQLVRVDTATEEALVSAPLWLSSIGEQLRFMEFDRQGQLWLAIGGPAASLKQINTADLGVAKKFDISALANGEGYTRLAVEDASTAWFVSASSNPVSLIRLDLPTSTQTRFPLGSVAVHDVSLAKDKGVAYSFAQEPVLSQYPTEYLQFLP